MARLEKCSWRSILKTDPNLRILENRPEELFGRLHAVFGKFAHRFSFQ
jgi:hypothetical protein